MNPRKLPFCLLLTAASCAQGRAPAPPSSETAALGPLAVGSAPAPIGTPSLLPDTAAVIAPAVDQPWREAVRLERWADAAALLDALPEAERGRAEMRYVRARAAVGTGDGARALTELAGLDALLPLLVNDLARWRAEAQLLAGPYRDAAVYFARSTKTRDLVRASQAWDRAGDAGAARRTADLAVLAAQRSKSTRDEAHARMHRARLVKGFAAEPDLRWIAVRAPGTSDGRAASEGLERLKKPLSAKERKEALGGLADPGSADASKQIERIAKPVPAIGKPSGLGPELLHAKGMALFKARDWEGAARAFREGASMHGQHEAEDLYQAGRSLARAEHDDEAIRVWRDLVGRFRRGPFVERAAYFSARLMLQGGRYRDAAEAYAKLLAQGTREHKEDAEYERALALLSSGGADEAARILAARAQRARGDEGPRLRQLQGVAALRAGDKDGAVAIWTDLARSQPLTWASLASRARLASVGAELPPQLGSAAIVTPPSGRSGLDLRLPPAPALLVSVGLDGDAESHLLAGEREASAAYPGREGEALCGLYGLTSRARRRYRIGVTSVDAGVLFRAPSISERWAWDCVYPQPFAGGVRELEDRHGIPRGLVHALMRQESAFDPAIVSPASAVGLMQLMPATAKQAANELSMDFDDARLTSPDVNLRLGAFYIAKLLKMFQGNVALASAAYNAGPRAVSHWLDAGGEEDVDLWVARIPFDETRNYVARVAQNLARYQWLQGGDAAVGALSLPIPKGVKAPSDAY